MNSHLKNIFSVILALVSSMIISGIILLLTEKNPLEIYLLLFSNALSDSYGWGQILFKATSYIFTGLSVAFAFKAGLFNIGAEGQLNVGAFATALAGFTFVSLPWIILIPLCIAAGFIAGAFWAAIAGYLKARFGSHEVINTIMLNFIAIALTNYLVNTVYSVPASVHTPEISGNAVLMQLSYATGLFKGSPFNFSVVIALIVCIVVTYLLKQTRFGYSMQTFKNNPGAAKYAHMNTGKITLWTMAISGGLSGLVGTNLVMGYKHYYELGFSEGIGYMGIAVALISRSNPINIIFTAIFFGIIEYGGLTVNTIVPKEIVTILQSLIIICLIVFTSLSERNTFIFKLNSHSNV